MIVSKNSAKLRPSRSLPFYEHPAAPQNRQQIGLDRTIDRGLVGPDSAIEGELRNSVRERHHEAELTLFEFASLWLK